MPKDANIVDEFMKLVKQLPNNFYQNDVMKSVHASIGRINRKSYQFNVIQELDTIWYGIPLHLCLRTYKFTCRAISTEEGEIYAAKNVLQRKLDKQLDEITTLPIERCHGIVVTGKFNGILQRISISGQLWWWYSIFHILRP